MTDIDMLIHDLEANMRSMEVADEEWVIQEGCSWRRIGTVSLRYNDGNVLRPYVARDGHPDIQSAYGVLLHIRLSQPRNLRTLLDEIATLRQQIEEAREALKPFADAAFSYEPAEGDDADVAWSHDFTIGSLRRARKFGNSISPAPIEDGETR